MSNRPKFTKAVLAAFCALPVLAMAAEAQPRHRGGDRDQPRDFNQDTAGRIQTMDRSASQRRPERVDLGSSQHGRGDRGSSSGSSRGSYGDRGSSSGSSRGSYGDRGSSSGSSRGSYRDRGSSSSSSRGSYSDRDRGSSSSRGSYGDRSRGSYGDRSRGSYGDRDHSSRYSGSYGSRDRSSSGSYLSRYSGSRSSSNHHDYRGSGHRDDRRWRRAQQRRDFYRDRARLERQTRWLRHMNHGWSGSRYYGHYGPSSRWRYHDRYYSYGYNDRNFAYYDGICRYDNNDDGAIIGALLGAIIGGAAANEGDEAIGILLGAGFGAALGSAVDRMDDCDRAQYQYAMNYAFEHNQPYYWGNPHSGLRGSVVVRETYYYNQRECRWGDAEIYMPDGTYTYDQVRMCRDAYGDWEVARTQ